MTILMAQYKHRFQKTKQYQTSIARAEVKMLASQYIMKLLEDSQIEFDVTFILLEWPQKNFF